MRTKKLSATFFNLYIVQLFVWPISRLFRLFKYGDLAMYLLGGVAFCGGLGIVFAWFLDSFDFTGERVLNAMIVFVPSIVGTSFFDLIVMLCSKKNQCQQLMPTYIALWLIFLSFVLLVCTGVAYYKERPNPSLTYWVWGLSLAYWTVINADDTKFNPKFQPNNTEGGDAMRTMEGLDTIVGVKS